MTRSVVFDDNGNPVGVHRYVYEKDAEQEGGVIVGDDVAASDEEILNTWYLAGDEVKERPLLPSQYHYWDNDSEQWVEDLSYLREDSLSKIDSLAESTRLHFITPGNGQAMTYEEKYRQALAGGGAMITAEAEALDMTEQEVIDSVLAARAQWEQLEAQIEATRLKAKKQIRSATTAAEMHSTVKAMTDHLMRTFK